MAFLILDYYMIVFFLTLKLLDLFSFYEIYYSKLTFLVGFNLLISTYSILLKIFFKFNNKPLNLELSNLHKLNTY